MALPEPYTPQAVRARSPLLTTRYPAVDPYDAETDALNDEVATAIALVASTTCRSFAEGMPGEDVPEHLVPVALRAIALKTEQVAVGSTEENAEQAAAGQRLKGFTAGPYSESYFGGSEGGLAGVKRPVLDANPALNEALWALATEACREALMAELAGRYAPAGEITSFAYGERGYGW